MGISCYDQCTELSVTWKGSLWKSTDLTAVQTHPSNAAGMQPFHAIFPERTAELGVGDADAPMCCCMLAVAEIHSIRKWRRCKQLGPGFRTIGLGLHVYIALVQERS